MIRTRTAAVLAALVPALILATPGSAAFAADRVIDLRPLNQPSSVVGSFDAATPLERARVVGNTLPQGSATPPVTQVPGFRVAGGALSALSGFQIGWQIGTAICGGLPFCEGGLDRDPAYVPNADASAVPVSYEYLSLAVGGSKSFQYQTSYGVGTLTVTRVVNDGANCPTGGGNAVHGTDRAGGCYRWLMTGNTTSNEEYVLAQRFPGGNAKRCSWGNFMYTDQPLFSNDGFYRSMNCWDAGDAGQQSPVWAFAARDPAVSSSDQTGWKKVVWVNDTPPSADPDRRWRVDYTCRKATATVNRSKTSGIFRESEAKWPKWPDAECSTADGLLDSVTVTEVCVTVGQCQDVVRYTYTTSPAIKNWQDTFPKCGDGTCQLVLWRVKDGRLSCFANSEVCREWFEDPNKAANYECTYGGTVVALSECNAYATVFNPATATRTVTKPKPDGSTETVTEPNYADPATGANTETGTTPVPEPTEPGADCPPDINYGLSLFNPWWYWKAGTCVMVWAFVPSTDSLTKLGALRTDFVAAPPGSWLMALGGIIGGIGDGYSESGGCGAFPNFADPAQTEASGELRIPCDPPGGAAFTTVYNIISGVLIVGAVATVGRIAMNGFQGRSD